MSGSKKPIEPWSAALKFLGRCPICNTAYEPDMARSFAQKDSASLIHITCGQCQSHFVAMVVVAGQGLSTVGMVTDLNYDDAAKMYNREPISLDEIIASHENFKNNLFKSLI